GTGIALPPRRDPPSWPPGRPPTYDTTDASGRFRPRGARRIPAGATGAHARQVVRQCGRTAVA
ncbi:MAG TPA: hypothetical protein VEW03_00745, partial [Longimicrobiaceae bacterium]|nr:hypothetical protein [Longimicrobiaceae bacterium]